ncbi:hypothetical protein Brsp02_04888 [Brucella sp. NBRC 113783]|jgi:2',3'-cyclic-nucleotide 2'-phosphodiesterase/3'-nucleotidase
MLTRLGETPLQDRGFVAPFVLLNRELRSAGGRVLPVTIGILGLTPPETLNWNQCQLEGKLYARPMVGIYVRAPYFHRAVSRCCRRIRS